MNFKDIHIGKLIKQKVAEDKTDVARIYNAFKCSDSDIDKMYYSETIDTALLLKWSKLLHYDFFRIYSHHIMLYSSSSQTDMKYKSKESALPQFRKNIYTKEIIDFILENVNSGKMSKLQVIEEYKIPKTTLYKWFDKYNFQNGSDEYGI